MELQKIIELDKKYYLNTFGDRTPVAFDYGRGAYLYTEGGEEYLDFFAGIAVSALGHAHKDFTAALHAQIDKVLHTSSLYYIENQARLAEKIAKTSCADRVYFANSGAEANEGAVKLAKIYFYKKGRPEKNKIITLKDSFHGRTLAMVAATGQSKYQKPYNPIYPNIINVAPNDFDALYAAVDDETAAIMLEAVQGESGVHVMDDEYLECVRRLCDEKEIILIFDEVQTGMGRTGEMYAYQTTSVEPDIFTLAKALGGGVPIGAVCAKEKFSAFEPGDHGGTFGGNPLATAAGLAIFDIFEKENILANVRTMGGYFENRLREIDGIGEIRRKGLMLGVEVKGRAQEIKNALFEKKVLCGAVGADTLRILPPLIIGKTEVDLFVERLKSVI